MEKINWERVADAVTDNKGWLIGDFPTALFKDSIEFALKVMKPGEVNPVHSHASCDEYTFVITGRGEFFNESESVFVTEGDLVKIPKNDRFGFKIPPEQAYNTVLIVIKNSSNPKDKVV